MPWWQHVGWWLQTLRKVRVSEPYHWNQLCHHWALQQEIIGAGTGAVLDKFDSFLSLSYKANSGLYLAKVFILKLDYYILSQCPLQ